MRKALILALGLSLVGTAAFSQSSARDDDDWSRGDYASSRDDQGHHGRWHGGGDRWGGHDDGDRGGRMRGDMRGEMHREMHGDMSSDEGSGRGARFFLRNGDAQLRIVCGNRDSTQSCIDAALRLFDRVQSQSRPSAPSSPGSPPSAQ